MAPDSIPRGRGTIKRKLVQLTKIKRIQITSLHYIAFNMFQPLSPAKKENRTHQNLHNPCFKHLRHIHAFIHMLRGQCYCSGLESTPVRNRLQRPIPPSTESLQCVVSDKTWRLVVFMNLSELQCLVTRDMDSSHWCQRWSTSKRAEKPLGSNLKSLGPVSRTNGENTLVEVLHIKPVKSVNPFQSDNVGGLSLAKTPALTAA